MNKTLLHVQIVKNGICSTECHYESTDEKEKLAASILSLMDQDEEFAELIMSCVGVYALCRKELSEVNKAAIRAAEIKTKN